MTELSDTTDVELGAQPIGDGRPLARALADGGEGGDNSSQ